MTTLRTGESARHLRCRYDGERIVARLFRPSARRHLPTRRVVFYPSSAGLTLREFQQFEISYLGFRSSRDTPSCCRRTRDSTSATWNPRPSAPTPCAT